MLRDGKIYEVISEDGEIPAESLVEFLGEVDGINIFSNGESVDYFDESEVRLSNKQNPLAYSAEMSVLKSKALMGEMV